MKNNPIMGSNNLLTATLPETDALITNNCRAEKNTINAKESFLKVPAE